MKSKMLEAQACSRGSCSTANGRERPVMDPLYARWLENTLRWKVFDASSMTSGLMWLANRSARVLSRVPATYGKALKSSSGSITSQGAGKSDAAGVFDVLVASCSDSSVEHSGASF
jgi:hypothetical protein